MYAAAAVYGVIMRSGLFINNGGLSPDEVVERVRTAAEAGLSSAWLLQVFSFDALIALAIAGREVSGIELGTAVVQTYPHHPLALAHHRPHHRARKRC